MAIQRPITKSLISTTGWGIPITDEVNRLSAWQLANPKVAWGRIVHASQPNAQNSIATSPVDIAGLSATFVAVVGRYYQIHVGGLILYATGAGVFDLYVTDGANTQLAKGNIQRDAAGWMTMVLSTPPMTFTPGSVTVKARASMSTNAVNTAQGGNGMSFITVMDVGPTT